MTLLEGLGILPADYSVRIKNFPILDRNSSPDDSAAASCRTDHLGYSYKVEIRNRIESPFEQGIKNEKL